MSPTTLFRLAGISRARKLPTTAASQRPQMRSGDIDAADRHGKPAVGAAGHAEGLLVDNDADRGRELVAEAVLELGDGLDERGGLADDCG